MIVCAGSIALDTTHTPYKTFERILGGSASFFGICASYFSRVSLVSVVGRDFPEQALKELGRHCDLSGVARLPGKSFFYESEFGFDLQHRKTLKFEPNVYAEFDWTVPPALQNPDYLFLNTHNPDYNERVLGQSAGAKMAFGDTIEYLVQEQRPRLLKFLKRMDGFILNDSEARILSGEQSLVKAGKKLQAEGPEIVVIKKGEHGGLLFYESDVLPFPAFPIATIVDPTGAGDSFAGGFIGWLDKKKRVSEKNLREACFYGTVLASLCVQEHGIGGLIGLTDSKIQGRYREYKRLAGF